MGFKILLTLKIAIWLCLPMQSVSGSRQKVIFFSGIDCKGKNETISVSADESALNRTLAISAESVKVFGLWRITYSRDYGGPKTSTYAGDPPQGKCYNTKYTIGISHFSKIEMFGPSEMTTTYFAVYTDFFQGDKFVTWKPEAQMPPWFSSSSWTYMLFSNTTWVAFSEPNLKGSWFCMSNKENGYYAPYDGFSYGTAHEKIASVSPDTGGKCAGCGKECWGMQLSSGAIKTSFRFSIIASTFFTFLICNSQG